MHGDPLSTQSCGQRAHDAEETWIARREHAHVRSFSRALVAELGEFVDAAPQLDRRPGQCRSCKVVVLPRRANQQVGVA